MKPGDDDGVAGPSDEDAFTDRGTWLPPPTEEWQREHGWEDGHPPQLGNGKSDDAGQGQAGPPELLIGEPADDEASIPQREYVVPGYLPRAAVTELIGPPGAGKSQLCITWAVALALGREVGGFNPGRPMPVALFNVEDDITEQQRRVAAALRMFGATKADLAGRLRLLIPARTGMLLMLDPSTRTVKPTALMGELIDAIDDFRPDLLILDPLVELHDVQENDNAALRHVVAELRTIARSRNMAILLLHHTPKGDPRPGDQDAGRGASAVAGAVRKSFTLYEMTKSEARGWKIAQPEFYFRLDGAKANHDAKNGTEWFERIPIKLDNGDWTAAARPWSPPSETVTSELVTQLLETVAAGDRGSPWSCQLGKYARSISGALESAGIGNRAVQETALKALFAAGCTEAQWRKKNRNFALGLRHPDGRPNVDWDD